MRHYILEGHTPVEADWERYIEWMKNNDFEKLRRVGWNEKGDVRVSTVFLGLDHSYGQGEPMLFETMIFGGPHNEWQDRCSTWDQAIIQHVKACELAGVPYQSPSGDMKAEK